MMHLLVRVLMLLVLLAAMGDVWSTNRAIARGAKEANPVMALFMRLLGDKWVMARLLFALLNIWMVMRSPATAETWKGAASFGLNVALMAWVIWHNVGVGNQQLARGG